MFCRKCGKENPDDGLKCISCGALLRGVVTDDSTLGGLIPYKNSSALIAYYLAVFSPIPCVGLFLGAAGDIEGAKIYSAKAKKWCWIAFWLGLVSGIIYVGLQILARKYD